MQFELLAPIPTVTLARQLKLIPLFRFTSIDELFRVSTIAQQVRYEEKARVQERGAQPAYIQVLLEGEFEVTGGDAGASKKMVAPAMLGFREVVEGAPLQSDAVATRESVALVMPAEEFRTLLSANIELAQGLFRMLLDEEGANGIPSLSRASQEPQTPSSDDELKTVDKVLYLETVPVFGAARGEELYELAAISRDVALEPGKKLFSEGHPSSIWLLLSGDVTLESSEGERTGSATAGDCLGVNETLAGTDWSSRAEASSGGRALQIERDALFELLADRMDLLQEIFAAIFRNADPST